MNALPPVPFIPRPHRDVGGEIIIDSFAGGGGASQGIFQALGRHPDVAINHDPEAVAMHAANHPDTVHYCQSVYRADPKDVAGGRPVGLLWASPDCKHFSKAKGGQPLKKNIRDLAWVVVTYAERVRPRVIILENVEEYRQWCDLIPKLDPSTGLPVLKDGMPVMVPDRTQIDADGNGATFKRWVAKLRRNGYRVEWRELRGCDYGAPTIRKRLYIIARRDGQPIVWPVPSHGAPDSPAVLSGQLQPWPTAARDVIDWSLPCPSIFLTPEEARAIGVRRPLADATMRRIALGVKRFVLDAARPFIVNLNHTAENYPYFRGQDISAPLRTATVSPGMALVAPFVSKFSENSIGTDAGKPIHTVMAGAARHALVTAFLAQHNTGVVGHDARKPVSTITATGTNQAVVAGHILRLKGTCRDGQPATEPLATLQAEGNHLFAVHSFIVKYYGSAVGCDLEGPLHTDTTKPRFGLVTVPALGPDWALADIGMRMLTPRERFRAQGFPDSYVIDVVHNGKVLTQEAQGRLCGNSVCPDVAAALVGANVPELALTREAAE